MGRKLRVHLKNFKSFALELLSFDSPRAIVLDISLIFFILILTPIDYIKYSPVKCIFKNFILPIVFGGNCPAHGIFAGCNCPACGLTRAMCLLLKGDISGALSYNVLVMPLFLMMLSLWVFNLYKIKKSRKQP